MAGPGGFAAAQRKVAQQRHTATDAAGELRPRDSWQGRILHILDFASRPEACDAAALRTLLKEAVLMSQQHPLARISLVPLELQRLHDRAASSPEDLGLALQALLTQFEVPLYHMCRNCGARRLCVAEPAPPPGRFSCGHMACVFTTRECKAGGWDEERDWQVRRKEGGRTHVAAQHVDLASRPELHGGARSSCMRIHVFDR